MELYESYLKPNKPSIETEYNSNYYTPDTCSAAQPLRVRSRYRKECHQNIDDGHDNFDYGHDAVSSAPV